jgi:surfeit locus 1 family protein
VKPARLLAWLGALLLATVFASLGAWQYGRGEWKTAWEAQWQAALAAPAVALPRLPAGTRIERPLRVAGTLPVSKAAGWLLLDNQRRGAEVGLRAYRLLETAGGSLLLADFGWLPFDRAKALPNPALPEGRLDTRGLLLPWPGQGMALGDAEWPRPLPAALLLTRLDREAIAAAVGQPLVDGVLKIDPATGFGFARDLDALPNTLPAEKHYGYALQWWGFALTVLIIAVVLQRRSARA